MSLQCDRFQVSNQASAAVATTVLQDYEIITDTELNQVINRSKLWRKCNRWQEDVQAKEDKLFSMVNAIDVDSLKDAKQITSQVNDESYRRIKLEEHYVIIVGEPGEFYHSHVTPEDAKGSSIAQALYAMIKGTEMNKNLLVLGSDNTATMTSSSKETM